MKRLKTIILTTALLGATAIGLSACGWRHHDEAEVADYISKRVTRKLELDASQQNRLDELIVQLQSSRKVVTADRESHQRQLLALLQADILDQQSLLRMINTKTALLDQEAPAVVAALAGFTDSLTPEQRKQLNERLQDKFDHKRHWR